MTGQQVQNTYRTNKSFLARFTNNNSLALSKNETNVEIKCLNDLVCVKNEKKQASVNHAQDLLKQSGHQALEQGNSVDYEDRCMEINDVNIRRFGQDKSKLRSEFMQR
jgi:hypothetical protein